MCWMPLRDKRPLSKEDESRAMAASEAGSRPQGIEKPFRSTWQRQARAE